DSLVTYARVYSWEIRQRERVETAGELDLKKWDLDQIVAEANRAYLEVWLRRAEWGSEPIGTLARYLQQNNFPPRIRGTLRDAVTYLWVGLLADSSLWSPAQSNEIFQLDPASLIEGDAEISSALDLADAEVHPLLKIGALLDDLEKWHASGRRPEAALEVRLERLRRLHLALTGEEDRLAIRRYLETVQRGFDRSYEWWSMGQATLAEFIRQESGHDALVRARGAALTGRERHPRSIGGQRCAHIVASIEAPSYSLGAMAADGPDRRSLKVDHRNIPALHFRAYRYDLVDFVEHSEDYNLLPRWREAEEIMARREPDAEWSVELPPTPDFRSHATYVVPRLAEPGAYLVVASMRADFSEYNNSRVAENFLLTDLVLLTRRVSGGFEVTARSGASGRALAGVRVSVYRFNYQRGHREVELLTTGDDGRARLDQRRWKGGQYFLIARHGQQLALDRTGLFRHNEAGPGRHTSALVYTDRSVYRPQQKIFWKVVGYRGGGEKMSYRTLPRTPVHVSLLDANGEQVARRTVTTNGFGSASGEFEIPSGRLLGRWRLSTSLGGQAWLRVEEYKRPTFEVTVSDPPTPLRLNREAALSGEVRYYFGLPVVSGSVSWRVTREPVYPRWWFWWRPAPSTNAQVVAAGEASLDDEGRFDIRFTPKADEREARRGVTYRYRLGIDVTDEGGETRSASRVFRLGFVAVEASITDDLGFLTAGEAASVRVLRTDLDGTPRAGRGQWRLLRLEQPLEVLTPADQPLPAPADEDAFRTPGDGLRPRWQPAYGPEAVLAGWAEGAEIARGEAEHGEDGAAEVNFPGLAPGAYRVVYTTRDEYGAAFTTMKNLVVAGERRTPLALPALLRFERSSVAVGERARLLVFTGFKAQDMVLEIYRDGRRIERREIGAGRSGVIEFPITSAERGGFGVTLTLVRDHQLIRRSARVFVPWDDRRLDLEFATFRDRMRPGTRETFQVTVRGHDGAEVDAGAAELLAYMYDRSLDIFAPHEPPDPLLLYPNRTGTDRLWVSLGQAQQAWSSSSLGGLPGYPALHGDRLEALDGYGIGGPGRRRGPMRMMKAGVAYAEEVVVTSPAAAMAMDAVEDSKAEGEERLQERLDVESAGSGVGPEAAVELRSDFSETAFWEPHLLLGDDGSATVSFEVPDSVTEWNLWVHALTTDLRSGAITRRTRSVKELMVRPYLPRFLREGDRAVLKVVVNNAGEEVIEGRLNLRITDPETDEDLRSLFGLEASETSGVPFSVEPGEGADLSFELEVPARVGTVAFKVTARAGAFSDGELRPLPVLPGRMHLMQSRFVTLHDADRRELHFADMAADDDPTLINDQLVVTIDAQLFYSVLGALPYLVSYPYECTEQTLNRFLSTGIVGSLFEEYPAVEAMAQKLSKRDTRLETWDATDPNRKMELEETPWLQTSRGGQEAADDLVNVLDPRITRAQRDAALAKLKKSQTSLGAFPWWPG
ncbi:MAG: alpha-2-macroglobulin family protein, partial [Thermoanaerobaculales bacterium]